jgi:ElaB/YqjD/DUF883 family membrane-anchored ribosome-binding protein
MERTEYESSTGNGDSDIREVAAAKLEDVREWSADVLDRVESFVRERPATALLCALGAGFVIGRLIRRV